MEHRKDSEIRRGRPRLSLLLCAVFFLSGASALIFETLWFRLAGLTFGNSVWASALVLSSFMGGLALGNAVAAMYGSRISRPIRLYAIMEVLIAVTGLALVLVFPLLSEWLAPVFRPFLDRPFILNALRLSLSFGLMLLPATAMGMTLPLLVKALCVETPRFGRVLGRLYGWNTLGAVAGAIMGEGVLIGWFGVRGAGMAAGLLNLLAAGGALLLSLRFKKLVGGALRADKPMTALSWKTLSGKRFLLAGFLSGGILLALEVVWFRFLKLYLFLTSFTFALMLAVVLAGIGLGGLCASLWLRWRPEAHRWTTVLALVSGGACVAVYGLFAPSWTGLSGWLHQLSLSIQLVFPISLLSGILFTFIGTAAHEYIGEDVQTAGLLTLANTTGAMLGSLAAGFLLLPGLGMEKSFFVLAAMYGAVALLTVDRSRWRGRGVRELAHYAVAALFVAALALFPFGSTMKFLDLSSKVYRTKEGSRTVAVFEGMMETIQYLEKDFQGRPLYYRLLTDSFNMSGTNFVSQRYMRLFVYWPMAVHASPRSALLISYGVGVTAKALTDTPGLESIDVVDISRDVLRASSVVYPDPADNPLHDPRVRVHIEDGRFFLQTTPRRYDLITGEPPPPKARGVVNLYSEEYFSLIYDRLRDGGIVTYWLPVSLLSKAESQNILRAFANVFEHSSLWAAGFNWMMVGIKGDIRPVAESVLSSQWRDGRLGPTLRAFGFEEPEQMGSLFLMDSSGIEAFTAGARPLRDNFPKRVSDDLGDVIVHQEEHRPYMSIDKTAFGFSRSPFVRRLFPAPYIRSASRYFVYQDMLNTINPRTGTKFSVYSVDAFHHVKQKTDLETLLYYILNSEPAKQEIIGQQQAAGRAPDGETHYHLGVRALVEGEFDMADRHFFQAIRAGFQTQACLVLRLYALCAAGQVEEADRVARENDRAVGTPEQARWYLEWLGKQFGFRQRG